MRLRPLTEADEAEARRAHRELAGDGIEFLLALRQDEAWTAYLQRIESMLRGEHLPNGWVPATFLVPRSTASWWGA